MDDPALNEIRIPAGSNRQIDIAACADPLGGFRMWTNRSTLMLGDPQFALGDRDVFATLGGGGAGSWSGSHGLQSSVAASGA